MGSEDNGLTLEKLAQKLEMQARRLEALERENTELRHKVATLESPHTHRDELDKLRGSEMRRAGAPASESEAESEGQVSRRWLLSKAGAAAVGTVAAGALMLRDTREAKPNHFGEGILVNFVLTHWVDAKRDDGATAIYGSTNSGAPAVEGLNNGSGPGVKGTSQSTGVEGFSDGAGSTGVKGTGRYYGIWGESSQSGIFSGVFGRNTNGTGVRGVGGETGVVGKGKNGVYGESSTTNHGAVVGRNTAQGKGVYGECVDGTGVEGSGKNGVVGTSSTPDGWGGVVGRNNASAGVGTYGEGLNGIGVQGVGKNGVHGKSSEPNYGAVYGEHTANGSGVWGISTSGYGGQFQGGKAQLKLKPGGAVGKPSGAHAKGEIYMDSAGALFVCVTGGNPATWRKVSTTTG